MTVLPAAPATERRRERRERQRDDQFPEHAGLAHFHRRPQHRGEPRRR